MRSGRIVVLAVVVLACAIAFLFRLDGTPTDPRTESTSSDSTPSDTAPGPSEEAAATVRESAGSGGSASVTPGERGRIVGRVVDLEGAPLSDIALRASDFPQQSGSERHTVETRSDANGQFHFEDLVAGKHYEVVMGEIALGVSSYGMLGRSRGGLVPRNAELDLGEIPLVEALRVRGVVVDLADEPIEGAVVDPERPGLRASNPTGRDGRFEVDIIPGEDVVLTPRKPGYVAESRSSDLVIVRPGESVADRTLRMRGTRPLRGWVVDQKGRPIVGATVEIDTLMVHYAAETYDLQQNTRVTKTRTDSAGRFDGFVPLERGARITVTAPTRESRNIDIAGDVEDCRIEIQLDPVLRVRCIDGSTGAVLVPRALTPVAAVRELSSLVGSRARQDFAIDADGAARVPLRTSVGSPARIAAWVDGYLLALSEPIERTADGEAKPDAIVISMQRGGQVEGRVVEFDGSPARAVRIVAKRHPAAANEPPIELGVCGSDGEFRISSLAPGRYEIFGLRGEEATPATSLVEIAASSSPGSLELRFAPSGTIVGLVHDAGVPLPDVRIRSVAVDGRERRIATSDAKGRFVVEGIPAGEIALVIGTANDSDRGAAHATPTRVVVVPGQSVSAELDLQNTDFAVIHGRIGQARRSLSGCRVSAASNSGATNADVIQGEVLLAPIPPGTIHLSLDLPHTPEPIDLLDLTLAPKERKTLDLTIELGSIRGVVHEPGATGSGHSSTKVNPDEGRLEVKLFEFDAGRSTESREPVGRKVASRTPDESQAFRFSAVPPGTYLIVASRGRGKELRREQRVVRVIADSELEVTIDLLPAGSLALRSNAAFDDRFDRTRLHLSLERADGFRVAGNAERASPTELFTLPGISPGMYRVTVRDTQGGDAETLATFDVVVSSGVTTELKLPTPR